MVNHHAPRWEVGAYYRLASLLQRFHTHLRRAPLPPDIARHPELIDAYESQCDPDCMERRDAHLRVATEGYQRCLRTAVHLREVNEFSRACEAALHAIERGRFPLADEVAPPEQGL